MEIDQTKLSAYVYVTTRFEAFHRWVDAPDEVAFLRAWHRHVFHVKLTIRVEGLNRSVEFILLKRAVDKYIREKLEGKYFEASCEMIAADLAQHFGATCVDVSEDGENGATVFNDAPPTVDKARVEFTEKSGEPVKVKVTELVRKNCFIGTEAEGPCRGSVTLFVPGNITPEVFAYAEGYAMVTEEPKRCYFGAGNILAKNYETLQEILKEYQPSKIDVEIENWEGLPKSIQTTLDYHIDIRVISRSIDDQRNPRVDYIKWVYGDSIIWKGKGQGNMYRTKVDDPLFELDKEIVYEEPDKK